jgi:tRNA 2-selenouridine synthase
VLGALPGQPQPSQKNFDTLVWDAMRQCDATQPVYVESESKKVGNLAIPTALVTAMRNSPCLNLVLADAHRVALLMEDYDFFVQDKESFCTRLLALTALRGKATIDAWQQRVRIGEIANVVQELLTLHYDPVYIQSMERNFQQFGNAEVLNPVDHSDTAMDAIAKHIVTKEARVV